MIYFISTCISGSARAAVTTHIINAVVRAVISRPCSISGCVLTMTTISANTSRKGSNATRSVANTPFRVRPISRGLAVSQLGGVLMHPVSLCSLSFANMVADPKDSVVTDSKSSSNNTKMLEEYCNNGSM